MGEEGQVERREGICSNGAMQRKWEGESEKGEEKERSLRKMGSGAKTYVYACWWYDCRTFRY